MKLDFVISKCNIKEVVRHINAYIKTGKTIGSISVVDASKGEVVLLFSDQPIPDEVARVWWAGFSAGTGQG